MSPGQHTTLYRIEIRGETYYSRMYKRVRKRNSYTVAYCDANGAQHFAHIVLLNRRVIGVLTCLSPLQVTCKDHFGLTTAALDIVLLSSFL